MGPDGKQPQPFWKRPIPLFVFILAIASIVVPFVYWNAPPVDRPLLRGLFSSELPLECTLCLDPDKPSERIMVRVEGGGEAARRIIAAMDADVGHWRNKRHARAMDGPWYIRISQERAGAVVMVEIEWNGSVNLPTENGRGWAVMRGDSNLAKTIRAALAEVAQKDAP